MGRDSGNNPLDTDAVRLFADAVRGHLGQGGAAIIATHIDLGLEARVLDLAPFRAQPQWIPDGDEDYL